MSIKSHTNKNCCNSIFDLISESFNPIVFFETICIFFDCFDPIVLDSVFACNTNFTCNSSYNTNFNSACI